MKLYYHPISSYSQKVLIAGHEKNVPFERQVVDLFDPSAREAYARLYPLGKVPLLQLDNGRLIPESTIIIEYLETHVDAGPALIPMDVDLARRVRFHDRQFDLYVADSAADILFEGLKPAEKRDASKIASAQKRLDVMYKRLDEVFAERTFCVGNVFTMADCAAAPALFYARMVHPFDAYKHLTAYAGRLAERPSVAKVRADAAPYLKAMASKS